MLFRDQICTTHQRGRTSAKKMMSIKALLGILALLISFSDAANILGIFAFPSKSHVGVYQPLLEELANRGHNVTVITPFPKSKKLKNYTELIIPDGFVFRDSKDHNLFTMKQVPLVVLMYYIFESFISGCERSLKQAEIQNLIHNSEDKFDLIIYEPFASQCTYGFLHKFNAPSVQVLPNTLSPMMNTMGNPSTTAYVPSVLSNSETVDFVAKLTEVIRAFCLRSFSSLLVDPRMDKIMRQYFPDPSIPHVSELENNASFVFIQSHPLISQPRPLNPNTIDVSGLHIKSNDQLPKDLKTFVDEGQEGVIYFSMGSNLKSTQLPESVLDVILSSFSKLKQRVVFKWEEDTLPGKPVNVMIRKWLPQHALLAHPHVKLFITHGGLASLQEAIFFGKPMICIPVAGDQTFNCEISKNRGLGIILDVNNLTEEVLDSALHELLHEPRYREAGSRLSTIYRDQPQTPLERAVFWAEYALRHKGAPHLRSAALNLSFVQYYLLDVLALLAAAALAALALLVWVARLLLRLVRRRASPPKASPGKKTN